MSLGKGLGALLSATTQRKKTIFATTAPPSETAPIKIWSVPISEITPNARQPRQEFKAPELADLAASIKTHGILQPLLVAEKLDGGYELIAGERRLRAAQLAGLAIVPVLVRPAANQEKLELALIENLQRENLNPIEEAFAFRRLMEEFGLTQEQVAARVGKSRPAIANTVRLLDLPAVAQTALSRGVISAGAARALLALNSEAEQLELLKSLTGEKISVRALEEKIRDRSNRAPKPKNANSRYLEDLLRAALGSRVSLSERGGSGAIKISFYSKDELRALIKKITGRSFGE